MTNFLSSNPENAAVSSVDLVNSDDGSLRFNAESLSSYNFDGLVPNVLDTAYNANEITPGMYFVIPGEDDTLRPVVSINPNDDDPDGEMEIIYLDLDNSLRTYTCDGDDQLTVQYESWDERVLGTQGWGITSGGNAIFTNVAVRGRIEAEEGYISESLTIGSGGSITFNDVATSDDVQELIDDLNEAISASISDIYLDIDSFSSSLVFLYEAGFVSSAQLITTGATQITGNNITTGIINANLVRVTSASSLVQNRGVQLSAVGLEGYNNLGQRTFFLNTDGSLTIGSNASIDGYVTDGELSSASSSLNSTIDTINERISASVSSLSSSLSDLSIDINSISASVDFLYNAGFVTDSDLVTTGGTTINGNNITTGTIDANFVEITSDLTQNRGVKITSLGLTAYNSSGQPTFNINSGTGAVTITGYATDSELSSGLSTKISSGGAASDINNNTTTISGGKITTGTITADRIQSGVFVTGTDLGASGTTTIDGGRITTGTISASRLDLSGVLTATDVGDSGSTVISGSRITTGSLSGDRISGGTITGTTIQSANSGRRVRISGLGGTDVVEFLNSSGIGTNIGIGVDNTNLYLSTSISGGKFICVPPVEFFSTLSAGQITNETSTVTTVNFYRNSATTAAEIMRLRSNVGGTGQIKLEVTANGTVRNSTGVYGTLSDERYKENLTLARNYLDDINKIKIFKYNLVNEEENFLGVSAQQVQTIFPNLVEEDNEGKLNVKTSVFIPMLISSVQELSEKVKDLQDRVLQLESQLGG